MVESPTASASRATLLDSGKVFVAGLTEQGEVAAIYDPASGKFSSIPLELPPGADEISAAVLLHDGRVLLYGSGCLETYDPSSGVYAPVGQFFIPGQHRWYPTATLLADGRVLFEGGDYNSDPTLGAIPSQPPSAALYDPNGGITLIGAGHPFRDDQTATLLPDGDVLIAGGTIDEEHVLSSAELFVP